MSSLGTLFYEFGPYRVDIRERLLLKNEEAIPLPPKIFDTLLVLVEHRGRVLDKGEMLDLVWPNTVVEESNLTHHVYKLRRALGERPDGHPYIETIPRRGYRFVASVHQVAKSNAEMSVRSLAVLPFKFFPGQLYPVRERVANALAGKR